jgi:DNA-binding CsgD family transcriptional regulator
MNTNQVTKYLTGSVIATVVLIGSGAFILSFTALHAIGIQNGMPPDWRGYIWPLLTDAGLVVFSVGLLLAQITRQPTRGWQLAMWALSLASMLYNVAHAPLGDRVGWVALTLAVAVNIWPALILVTATEALRHVLKTLIDRAGMVVTMTELGAQRELLERQKLDLHRQVADLTHRLHVQAQTPEAPRLSKEEQSLVTSQRREQVLHLLGEGLSQGRISRELGVDISTIKRDVAALQKQGRYQSGKLVRNGRVK